MEDLFSTLDSNSDVENEDDSSTSEIKLLEGVVVSDSDWTAETILSQLRKGNILLTPRFQRRDAWTDERKSRFIESLLLGIPIPQLVLAEVPSHKGRYLVIDGKQRLLSLQAFAGTVDLRLKLTGLSVRTDLNGLTWDDICEGKGQPDDEAAFENAPVRTTFVRGFRHERALYLIFHRLNSGSVPLSPQELRHVLHPGPFIDFAFDFTEKSQALIDLLGKAGKPDFRMRDVEMLIRFFAFQYFLEDYRGDLKEFLDTTVERLNSSWVYEEANIRLQAEQCEHAIRSTQAIFGNDAFSKSYHTFFERRFNRAVFDVMVFYFADDEVRKAAETKSDQVKNAYMELSRRSIDFRMSLDSTTKSIDATFTRLVVWGEALATIVGFVPRKLALMPNYQRRTT